MAVQQYQRGHREEVTAAKAAMGIEGGQMCPSGSGQEELRLHHL